MTLLRLWEALALKLLFISIFGFVFAMITTDLKSFVSDDKGAVAVEYGIIAMALFAAIIPAFLYVASGIQTKFSEVAAYFNGS